MHKKAPPTLVDDCINKFHQHEVEQKRLRLLNGQRGSVEHNPVEFLIGEEGDKVPPSLTERGEDTESAGVDDTAGGGFSWLPVVWSILKNITAIEKSSVWNSVQSLCSRGSFPECILEDSGFEEPQEFRTRCSSLAGSLQMKPGEGVIMGPPRRRHSSAPNHVQPSNAEKNRTMLFQVHAMKKKRTVKSHASYLCVRLTAVLVACQESCFQSQFAGSWKEWTPHIVNGMYILGVVFFPVKVSEFKSQDFFQTDVLFFAFSPESHSFDSQCPAIMANVVYFTSVSFAILLAFSSAAGSLAAMNHFYAQVAGSFNAQHSSALCCCFSLKRL